MRRRRSWLAVFTAALVLAGGLTIAIWLPRYPCREPYRLVPASGPGAPSSGWLCMHTDMGYSPDSRLLLKWGIAALTIVASAVVLTVGRTKPSG